MSLAFSTPGGAADLLSAIAVFLGSLFALYLELRWFSGREDTQEDDDAR
jgi:hypothetical protein